MDDENLFEQVQITKDGAVCLGNSLVCDGFEPGHKAAAFTHIHSDHIGDSFETCLHQYPIYMSKITADLLKAITDDTYDKRNQVHIVDYGSNNPIKHDDGSDYVTMLQSSHILGASQILLHTRKDVRILYSGDIAPDDQPPECDILVVDATHGSPHFDKKIEPESIMRRMLDSVLDSIDNKKPVCIHAHRGKLQEIMHVLTQHQNIQENIKFLSSPTDKKVASVYSKYGYEIREDLLDVNGYEGDEVRYGNLPWIEFRTSMDKTRRETEGSMHSVVVSGRSGGSTINESESGFWMTSDAHAELSGILRYIEKAKPRVVVTDNSTRTKNGQTLADIVSSRLGIPAKPMPE